MKIFRSKKEKRLEKLKNIISKASKELNLSELIYSTEWIFTLPGQDIKIADCSLHHSYKLPSGFNGYGHNDLEQLCETGFLVKIFESEEDPQTLEKEIKYKINLKD